MKRSFASAGLFLALAAARVAYAADAASSTPVAPAAPPTEVVILGHAKVDDAFAKGLPLLITTQYKIQAGRRVTGGVVEFHEHDTDILYVLEGSATLITGGKMVDPQTTASGEIRAKEITGGVTRNVVKGDMIVIPKGIPHWFSAVNGTFLYHVVKVTN